MKIPIDCTCIFSVAGIANVIIAGLAAYACITYWQQENGILSKPRAYLIDKLPKLLGKLVSCPICFGFYIANIFLILLLLDIFLLNVIIYCLAANGILIYAIKDEYYEEL